MRFSVEQIFLTTPDAKSQRPPRYHVVEAETLDAALHEFLTRQEAVVLGTVQQYPGFHAVATARAKDGVFTVELAPGSDAFRRTPGTPEEGRDRP